MANEVQVFNFEQMNVRTVIIDGEPWFVGKDVAVALGYSNTKDALNRHVDDEDKQGSRFTTSGQSREMTVINESGVYSLIFGSKLPSAKQFKRWVKAEVLPSIRKTGGYQAQTMTEMEIVAASANKLVQQEKQIAQIEKRQTSTESDLAELKNQMGLPSSMRRRFTKARNKRVAEVMGGYYGAAYQAKTVRSAVYKQLERIVKDRYDIESYGDLPIAKFDEAMRIVQNWQPDEVLMFAINGANEQTLLEA